MFCSYPQRENRASSVVLNECYHLQSWLHKQSLPLTHMMHDALWVRNPGLQVLQSTRTSGCLFKESSTFTEHTLRKSSVVTKVWPVPSSRATAFMLGKPLTCSTMECASILRHEHISPSHEETSGSMKIHLQGNLRPSCLSLFG